MVWEHIHQGIYKNIKFTAYNKIHESSMGEVPNVNSNIIDLKTFVYVAMLYSLCTQALHVCIDMCKIINMCKI